jgi:hypothetical protein
VLPALYLLFIGIVVVLAAGPFEHARSQLFVGIALLALSLVAIRWALRGAARGMLLLTLALAAFGLGPCTLFFLVYNALPPFEMSDATGAQWEIDRSVPGEVRYKTGYTVAVSAPRIEPTSSREAVWVIPVRFSNDRAADAAHVGRCSLQADATTLDPHRERAEIRALGDVDKSVVSFPASGSYEGRVAFEISDNTKNVRLTCIAHGYVAANFDLTSFARGQ